MKNNRNLGKEFVELSIFQDITIDDLCEKVATSLQSSKRQDVVEYFIVNLDLLFEDWDITVNLINHFDALKEEYLKYVLEEGEESPFKPKKINLP